MPPGLRKERQPREAGIGQDRERQRPAAAQHVANAAKERSADGPADQERGLDDGTMHADGGIVLRHHHKLRHKGRRDQRVEMHVETVEHPAQPCGESGTALLRRQIAKTGDVRSGWLAHAGASLSQPGRNGKHGSLALRQLVVLLDQLVELPCAGIELGNRVIALFHQLLEQLVLLFHRAVLGGYPTAWI